MSSPFTHSLGVSQGRIQDENGDYVFELGHAGGNSSVRVEVGDYSQVETDVTHYGYDKLVRASVAIVEPDTEDSTLAWDLVGYVDGGEFYRRRLEARGRSLLLQDIGLSIEGLSSPTTIAFRLLAVTP